MNRKVWLTAILRKVSFFHTITLFEICYALRCYYKGTGGHRLCPSWNCMIGVIINDTQAITFEEAAEVASKRNGSDLDCFTAPNSERKIVRFCVLPLCRKAAAHFLHTVCTFAREEILGEQGSRQFSAFVCVHQPDGFKNLLAGDFCCRRLFVLPGLGCCRGHIWGIEVCLDLLGQLQPGLVLCVGVGIH